MSSRKNNKKEQKSKIIEDKPSDSNINLNNELPHPENVNINYSDLYNKAKLYSPLSKLEEKWKLIPAFLQVRGLVKQHIDSFNYFTDIEIKKIIRSSRNYLVKSEVKPEFYIKYRDIHIDSIHEWSRKFFMIVLNLNFRTFTLMVFVTKKPARAGIHSGDQHKIRRITILFTSSRYCNCFIFQWLP